MAGGKLWEQWEDNIVHEQFPIGGRRHTHVFLPHRTMSAIAIRAKRIGVNSGHFWTIEQEAIIREVYPVKGCKGALDLLPRRTKSAVSGKVAKMGLSREWGHRLIDHSGYVVLTDKYNHPLSEKRGRLVEHRSVWWDAHPEDRQAMLDGATIHHKNGKRADNRLENLDIRYKGNHPKGITTHDMADTLRAKGWTCIPPSGATQ